MPMSLSAISAASEAAVQWLLAGLQFFLYPARAHGEVGPLFDSIKKEGQLLGLVGAIGVHLHQNVIAGGEAPLEAGDVGGAEAFFAFTVQNVHLLVLGGYAVGKLSRAVRAVVINHQDVRLRHCGPQPTQGLGERFQLVVGRDDRQDTQEEAFPCMERSVCRTSLKAGVLAQLSIIGRCCALLWAAVAPATQTYAPRAGP